MLAVGVPFILNVPPVATNAALCPLADFADPELSLVRSNIVTESSLVKLLAIGSAECA